MQEENARREALAATAAREQQETVTQSAEVKEEKKEAVEANIEAKVKEVKDPRKKKLEEKKKSKSEVEEKKPGENIKSFKIPKVKKSSDSDSKGMKLAEIDIFQTVVLDGKKKSVKGEEGGREKSSSRSKKVERESESDVEDKLEPPPAGDGATDSDSEPSLTIAEDLEDRMASRSSLSEGETERSDRKAETASASEYVKIRADNISLSSEVAKLKHEMNDLVQQRNKQTQRPRSRSSRCLHHLRHCQLSARNPPWPRKGGPRGRGSM